MAHARVFGRQLAKPGRESPNQLRLWETQQPMNMTERGLEHGLSQLWISLLVDTFNINLIYYPYRGLAIPWRRVVCR